MAVISRDGGRLVEYCDLNALRHNTPLPRRNAGFWFATTIPFQAGAIKHLQEQGFRPVRKAVNPNTGNLITFWWRAGNGRLGGKYPYMADTCCGLCSWNPDQFRLGADINRGLHFVAETSRKWDGERRMTYLGEFKGHHYYIGGGKPCRAE